MFFSIMKSNQVTVWTETAGGGQACGILSQRSLRGCGGLNLIWAAMWRLGINFCLIKHEVYHCVLKHPRGFHFARSHICSGIQQGSSTESVMVYNSDKNSLLEKKIKKTYLKLRKFNIGIVNNKLFKSLNESHGHLFSLPAVSQGKTKIGDCDYKKT